MNIIKLYYPRYKMSSVYFGTPTYYSGYSGAQQSGFGYQYGGPSVYSPIQQSVYSGQSNNRFDYFTKTCRNVGEGPEGFISRQFN